MKDEQEPELLKLLGQNARSKLLQPSESVMSGETSGVVLPVTQLDPNEEKEWLHALRAIRRQWRWSLAFAVGLPLCVAAVVLLQKPVYEPIARIEVDPPGTELFSLDPSSPSDSVVYAETQAKNLQTDQLAIDVIRLLRLDQKTSFVGTPVMTSLPENKDFSQTTTPSTPHLELTPSEHGALRAFRRSFRVQRETSSWLIDVSFASHDPKLAALVTNTVVEQFIETNYTTRHNAILQSAQWLSHQLDDIRGRMEQSNRALADFQGSIGITPIGATQSTFDEKISALNRELEVAEDERIKLEALLAEVEGRNTDSAVYGNGDPVVQELSKKLAAADADLKQALIIYGTKHPRVRELQAQVGELQAQLESQQNGVVASLKTNYAAAHLRENLLKSELKEAGKDLGKVTQYEALKKDAQANEALYNLLYTKVKEASIAAESKSDNIRWVDRASVLDTPTRPRPLLDIAMAMLAGVVGGVFLAFMRESVNSKVRTLDDMRTFSGLSRVFLVPVLKGGNGELKGKTRWWIGRNDTLAPPKALLLERPCSMESEAIRSMVTSVRLSRSVHPLQVLLVTSAIPAEGKTTIAANLGIVGARTSKTCIVDADLRKASLSVADIFGLKLRSGLADVLYSSCALDLALVPVSTAQNLTVLPAGTAQVAADLISSVAMHSLLKELRRQFQFIVIDSPPILPYADARALATLADGIVLVGRSGVTTREAVKRSLELLNQMQSAPVLGVVLNGVNFNPSDFPYDYGHAYQ